MPPILFFSSTSEQDFVFFSSEVLVSLVALSSIFFSSPLSPEVKRTLYLLTVCFPQKLITHNLWPKEGGKLLWAYLRAKNGFLS